MPDKSSNRVSSTRSYDFEVVIDDYDYSGDLIKLSILNSIMDPYPNFTFTFNLDPIDIFLDPPIFGQSSIRLSSRLLGQDESVDESLEFELMPIGVLQTKMPIRPMMASEANNDLGTQKELVPYVIKAIPAKGFKTMNSFVNRVFNGVTVKEVLEKLFSDIGLSSDNYQIDNTDINQTKYEQIVIPPTTLNNAIRYLDDTFGIYSGPLGYFCDYQNILYIMNLKDSIESSSTYTIYHLASDSSETEEIEEKIKDGNVFVSYGNIATDYAGNPTITDISNNPIFILKPLNNLYSRFAYGDLSSATKSLGLNTKNDTTFIHEVVKERKRIYNEFTGGEEGDPTAAASYLSRSLCNLALTSVDIDRNIVMEKLFDLGVSIELFIKTAEYQGLGGKYVFHSSYLEFNRTKEWESLGKITLIRTNKLDENNG